MGAISETLRNDLLQPEFSEGYAESFQDALVAAQIKVLREDNQWTQADLAAKLGTTQTAISRIENVNYSAWNISTLKKLARAFRVRLKISFETYGSLIHDVEGFSREALKRTPREKDPELNANLKDQSEEPEKIAAATAQIHTLQQLAGEDLSWRGNSLEVANYIIANYQREPLPLGMTLQELAGFDSAYPPAYQDAYQDAYVDAGIQSTLVTEAKPNELRQAKPTNVIDFGLYKKGAKSVSVEDLPEGNPYGTRKQA